MFTNEYVAVKFLFFLCFVYGDACGGGGGLDCEQSQFFFRFSEGSGVHTGLTDQEKRETYTRSLGEGDERKIIF